MNGEITISHCQLVCPSSFLEAHLQIIFLPREITLWTPPDDLVDPTTTTLSVSMCVCAHRSTQTLSAFNIKVRTRSILSDHNFVKWLLTPHVGSWLTPRGMISLYHTRLIFWASSLNFKMILMIQSSSKCLEAYMDESLLLQGLDEVKYENHWIWIHLVYYQASLLTASKVVIPTLLLYN